MENIIIKPQTLDDEIMILNADLDISDEEKLDFLIEEDIMACYYPDEIFNKEVIFMYIPEKTIKYYN